MNDGVQSLSRSCRCRSVLGGPDGACRLRAAASDAGWGSLRIVTTERGLQLRRPEA
jgi:hypothetical protein